MTMDIRLRSLGSRDFRTRAFVGLSLFVVLLCSSFTALFLYDQRQAARVALREQGETLVRLLAYNVRLGVFSESSALLRDPIEGVMRETDVLGVAAYNLEGNLLLREFRDKGGATASGNPPGEPCPPFPPIVQPNAEHAEDDAVLAIRFPVHAGTGFPGAEETFSEQNAPQARPIGAVVIVMDKSGMNLRVRRLLVRSFLGMAFFLVIGLAGSWFLVEGLTRSLRTLTHSVKTFDETGRTEDVIIEDRDEIGMLAAAFNHLTVTLRQREREKTELEGQLRQAQKLEAIGTLTGGIAHDFNNLLTTIIGFGDHILRAMPGDDPIRPDMQQISDAAYRAAKLTKGLLAISRGQVIEPQPVNLNDSLVRIRPTLHGLLDERFEMRVRLADTDIIVMADAGQVDQVILNLVTNARDAMPRGGVVTITAEVAESLPERGTPQVPGIPIPMARLTVSDTGSGIPQAIREKIFDPYFTTKERGRGTGLGLSIVYGIVRQFGGSVDLESEPGQGTTFRILLPLALPGVAPPVAVPAEPAGEADEGTATILLAEDEASVRLMVRRVLEGHGYHVIEAVDGKNAVRLFEANAPRIHLLVFDVIMPGMNGHQAALEIRRLDPAVKVLLMSGYASDILQGGGLASSGFHFIAKPTSVAELLRAVREALQSPFGDGRPEPRG